MSDSTSNNESIEEIIPKALGEYLLESVQGLREFYDEWPSANTRLKMPSVSIIAKRTEFKPAAVPYKIQVGTVVNNKALVKWVVGEYDIPLQLDIWAGSKEERDDIYDAVFNALNPKISPMGLVLSLDEYFGSLADYLYVGHEKVDDGEKAQRDEWRVMMNLLVTCKAIRDRKEFIITDTPSAAEIETEPGYEVSETVVVTE